MADFLHRQQAHARVGCRRHTSGCTTPEVKPGEAGPRWLEVLPGGQDILYVTGGTIAAYSDDANIVVQSLKTGQPKTLIQGGTSPHYLSTGHLVYAQGGRLLAVPFDLQRLELTGAAVSMMEDVAQGTGGMSAYSLARNGSLVYVHGGEGGGSQRASTLSWGDRKGTEQPLPASPRLQLPNALSRWPVGAFEHREPGKPIFDLRSDARHPDQVNFEGLNIIRFDSRRKRVACGLKGQRRVTSSPPTVAVPKNAY